MLFLLMLQPPLKQKQEQDLADIFSPILKGKQKTDGGIRNEFKRVVSALMLIELKKLLSLIL